VRKTLITRYDDWIVNRTAATVSFGCGDVRVQKQDLINLAAIKSLEGRKKLVDFSRHRYTSLMDITESNLLNLQDVLKDKKALLAAKSLMNLVDAAHSHRNIQQIIQIPSSTLLNLAGN
jgi:hypothetical protein